MHDGEFDESGRLAAAMRQLAEASAVDAPPRVEAAVVAAFRARRRAGRRWIPAAALAAAAAVLLMAVWLRPERPPFVREPAPAGFFAITPGPLIEPWEVAPVVRVRLGRRDAERLGLPVQWHSQITAMEVDVLVGRDGVAKAVRLAGYPEQNLKGTKQ
ncbi:MAG: hypothetical protein FJW39_00775 [Acidobacteria bacterium]|nr:hypothetical protein [Acidobacteriota bacterium]